MKSTSIYLNYSWNIEVIKDPLGRVVQLVFTPPWHWLAKKKRAEIDKLCTLLNKLQRPKPRLIK